MTPLFTRINLLRDLRGRLAVAMLDYPLCGIGREDIATLDVAITEMVERDKTLLTTQVALAIALGIAKP